MESFSSQNSKPVHEILKILIVDDSSDNRVLIKLFLKGSFHLIDEAENGLEAAQKSKETYYDLILMDINLPDMNGFEVLECLRGNPTTSSIPVVAISANAFQADIERATKAGFKDYITKPVEKERLMQVIDQFIS